MSIPDILFTESFQQLATATYPMLTGGYSDESWLPDDSYAPNGTLDISKIPLFTVDSRGLFNGGNTGAMLYTFRASGLYAPISAPWSPSYPFGYPFDSPSIRPEVSPSGFSIVPCPTRPGRKRFMFPGKKMVGRPLASTSSSDNWSGSPNCFSIRYRIPRPSDSVTGNRQTSISFVARFNRRTNKTTKLAWYFSVGYPSIKVRPGYQTYWRNYGLSSLCPGFFASYIIFGSSKRINLASGTPGDTETSTYPDGLPWVCLRPKNELYTDIPNPTSPGIDGDFFKFEFDRDYHIEILLRKNSGTNNYVTRPSVKVFIDGEPISNWNVSGADDVFWIPPEDTSNLATSDRVNSENFLKGIQFNFQMNHKYDGSVYPTYHYPEMAEESGPVLISDIVVGESNSSDGEVVFGPSTRVWGDAPNSDIEISFKRPQSFDSNASVVGAPMGTNVVDEGAELSGGAGDRDMYKTDGSSMPDFAGNILGVQIKSIVRAPSADGEVVSLLGERELGSTELKASNGGRYSSVAHTITYTSPTSPEEISNTAYGISVKEE